MAGICVEPKNETNMEAITVKELLEACKRQIKSGNGNRKILISADEEGNYFHELFFLFTPAKGEEIKYALPVSASDFDSNYLILG